MSKSMPLPWPAEGAPASVCYSVCVPPEAAVSGAPSGPLRAASRCSVQRRADRYISIMFGSRLPLASSAAQGARSRREPT